MKKTHCRRLPIRLLPVLLVLPAAVLTFRLRVEGREAASLERTKAALLLSRATYGARPGDFERILAMGTDAWLDEQLHPEQIDDSELEHELRRFPDLKLPTHELMEKYPRPSRAEREAMQKLREDMEKLRSRAEGSQAGMDPRELRRRMDEMRRGRGNRPDQVLAALSEAKLVRAVESERQLEEVLTDFWFNHFNVYARKNLPTLLNIPSYERDALRPHVLGKFHDLLLATAQHPAMLHYLDNWINTREGFDPREAFRNPMRRRGRRGRSRPRPDGAPDRRRFGLNENYARELLELHTLGVDGGYTQQDVIEVARCLTGWTVINPEAAMRPRRGGRQDRSAGRGSMRRPGEDGRFHFNALAHDEGQKTVLGRKITAGGLEDGLAVIKMLSEHPATARFISTKLAQRFVSDHPSEALVNQMAESFLRTGGDIREVLYTMFRSPRFVEEGSRAVKVKTPLELVVSTLRATSAKVTGPALARALAFLGMPLYLCQPPTGYEEEASTWLSAGSLLTHIRFTGELLRGSLRGVHLPSPPEDFELWASQILPGREDPGAARAGAALQEGPAQLEELGLVGERQAMALLLISPAFQRQ